MATMKDITQAIRRAIADADITRYRISQDTGVDQGQLSRFVNGHEGISLPTAELVLDYLGLELVIRPKQKSGKRRNR